MPLTAAATLAMLRPPLLDLVRQGAQVLVDDDHDYDALLAMVGQRTFVLLGEATHGTHEFYAMRADITRRLVVEKAFDAVAVEGDWPDVHRLDRYVRGDPGDSLDASFADFQRFPSWMWRNDDVRDFIAWLHASNALLHEAGRVGFHGMDLYSLYRSAEEVVAYLERVDPDQAEVARRIYACLDHVREPQEYAYAAAHGLRPDCREGATRLLADLRRKAPLYLAGDGPEARDAQFVAERNAHVVRNAERYYREMFGGRIHTWNLRDAHMVDTLLALHAHLRGEGRPGRIVVWAHNSHLGDARATEMERHGQLNIGQLVRERVGVDHALLVGFTTFTGHVTAARDWDAPAEQRWVRPAHPDSVEHLFHRSGRDRFFLAMRGAVAQAMSPPLLQRAIGVVYRPETELASHYFRASPGAQFDAIFHVDESTAVQPFDVTGHWRQHEPADTWPSGL